MNDPEWLENVVDEMLLKEAEHFGFQEALAKLPEATQRLVREVLERKGPAGAKQGRKGSPASDINALYPKVLWLVLNGTSVERAWKIVQDHIPRRTPQNAKRQFNRARGELEKIIHTAATSVVNGNPRRFRRAYLRIQQLLE